MPKQEKQLNQYALMLYLIMCAAIVVIIIYLVNTSDVEDYNELKYKEAIRDIVWYDAKGNVVEEPNNLIKLGSDNHMIYTVIPEDLPGDVGLCFRDKHVLFKAYVEDENVYEQHLSNSKLYTNSMGAEWVMIPLNNTYEGKKLEIEYELCYEEKGAGFDEVAIVGEHIYLIHILKRKAMAIFLPVVYMIIGVILILFDLMINKYMKEKHNLLNLGCLAIGVACYCFAETQITQLFIANQRITHLIPMFAMAVIPVPGILYTDTLFKFKYKHTAPIFTLISFLLFMVLSVLNYFDIVDYHESMVILQLMLLIGLTLMFYAMGRYTLLRIHAGKEITTQIRFTIVGLAVMTACGVIDILRYWLKLNQDPAKYVRIGFLVFLVCFSLASSRQIMDAFKISTKAELISRLAYEDGLTGLLNRTSYNETLARLLDEKKDVGIVMLDVNNLKLVNDNMGHETGDDLLICATDIIKSAFNKKGMSCFRIGGDEFVVLINTDNIENDCKQGIERLKTFYSDINESGENEFEVVIAAGYDVYDHNSKIGFDEVVNNADSRMYLEKRQLKGLPS